MGNLKLSGSEPFLEPPPADEPTETAPFIITIDTREQLPFPFLGIGKKVISVRGTLSTGDYAILGLEKRFCVERKSKVDLFGSVIQDRKRFERELIRMAKMERAAIVVECSMEEVERGLDQSKINPENVLFTAISWAGRYRIPWFFAKDRVEAEKITFHFLRFAWLGALNEDGHKNGIARQDRLSDGISEDRDPV